MSRSKANAACTFLVLERGGIIPPVKPGAATLFVEQREDESSDELVARVRAILVGLDGAHRKIANVVFACGPSSDERSAGSRTKMTDAVVEHLSGAHGAELILACDCRSNAPLRKNLVDLAERALAAGTNVTLRFEEAVAAA